MNAFSHISITDSIGKDSLQFPAVDTLSAVLQPAPSGMPGILRPYQIASDWGVTCILFLCFILLSYVLTGGKRYIAQNVKSLFRHKERTSLFEESAKPGERAIFMLVGLTSILSGVSLLNYFEELYTFPAGTSFRMQLLAVYIGAIVLYLAGKWGMYSFINWIFFDKERNNSWLETYFGLVGILSFALFPFTLLCVFFNLNFQISLYIVFSILAFAKILLFYKSIRNFFYHFYGVLHLILYFCALEVIPILLWWKGIAYMNSILILKI